jgi:phosphopantothenoylcysteine synthetase/decarboxylase
MLVAPLDANTLGKVASGICDNLLVSSAEFLCPHPSPGFTPSSAESQISLDQETSD